MKLLVVLCLSALLCVSAVDLNLEKHRKSRARDAKSTLCFRPESQPNCPFTIALAADPALNAIDPTPGLSFYGNVAKTETPFSDATMVSVDSKEGTGGANVVAASGSSARLYVKTEKSGSGDARDQLKRENLAVECLRQSTQTPEDIKSYLNRYYKGSFRAFCHDNPKIDNCLYMFYESQAGETSLAQALPTISADIATRVIKDVVSTVLTLMKANIVHGNLLPANIIIKNNKAELIGWRFMNSFGGEPLVANGAVKYPQKHSSSECRELLAGAADDAAKWKIETHTTGLMEKGLVGLGNMIGIRTRVVKGAVNSLNDNLHIQTGDAKSLFDLLTQLAPKAGPCGSKFSTAFKSTFEQAKTKAEKNKAAFNLNADFITPVTQALTESCGQ